MAAIVIVIKNPQKRHNFCNIRAIFEFFSDRAGPEKVYSMKKKIMWLWPFFEANLHRFFIPILEHFAMARQVIYSILTMLGGEGSVTMVVIFFVFSFFAKNKKKFCFFCAKTKKNKKYFYTYISTLTH